MYRQEIVSSSIVDFMPLSNLWKNLSGKKRHIALFIDGPNMIRKEFNLDLDDIRERIEEYGRIVVAKVFLNQFAPEKLIEAVANQGFEPLIALGTEEAEDIDVYLAVSAMEAIFDKNIDMIALVSRDTDFLPLVQSAKSHGKEVLIIGAESAFSVALRHAADYVETVNTESIKIHKKKKV